MSSSSYEVVWVVDHRGDPTKNATGGDYTVERWFLLVGGTPVRVGHASSCEVVDCCEVCGSYERDLAAHEEQWHATEADRQAAPYQYRFGLESRVLARRPLHGAVIEMYQDDGAWLPPSVQANVQVLLDALQDEDDDA